MVGLVGAAAGERSRCQGRSTARRQLYAMSGHVWGKGHLLQVTSPSIAYDVCGVAEIQPRRSAKDRTSMASTLEMAVLAAAPTRTNSQRIHSPNTSECTLLASASLQGVQPIK